MGKLSSLFNKRKQEPEKDYSEVDNNYFFRGDFEDKKYSELNEVEVEHLVAYIMRN